MILKVDDLSRGGAGVARDENRRVVFIPFSAPGDRVRVRLTESNKRFAQAEILEILEPSPIRREPPCPVFGRCGGCQWQHIPYELQWETKVKGVMHALKRVELTLPDQIEKIPAEQIWEYRNRVQLRGLKGEIGFYEGGSHRLVGVQRCDIARPEINEVWEEIRLEGTRFEQPYKVEVEVLSDGKIRKTWNSRHGAAGFRQVHDAQNAKMVQWVANRIFGEVEKTGNPIVLDLFGGSGNFSSVLAERAKEVHCVDVSSPRNRPAGFLANVFFHRAPVAKWLRRYGEDFKRGGSETAGSSNSPVKAILDPPRQGLGSDFSEIAKSLEDCGAQELIMIGCDPDSWARDLSRWIKRGWALQEILLIDLFPQTTHLESIGCLLKEN